MLLNNGGATMRIMDMAEPIIIDKSKGDSRDLIMPHQKKAVEAMSEYFNLDKDVSNRNGFVVMPTGSGKTYTIVHPMFFVANG